MPRWGKRERRRGGLRNAESERRSSERYQEAEEERRNSTEKVNDDGGTWGERRGKSLGRRCVCGRLAWRRQCRPATRLSVGWAKGIARWRSQTDAYNQSILPSAHASPARSCLVSHNPLTSPSPPPIRRWRLSATLPQTRGAAHPGNQARRSHNRQSLWLYGIPARLFATCRLTLSMVLSPGQTVEAALPSPFASRRIRCAVAPAA